MGEARQSLELAGSYSLSPACRGHLLSLQAWWSRLQQLSWTAKGRVAILMQLSSETRKLQQESLKLARTASSLAFNQWWVEMGAEPITQAEPARS